MEKDYEIKRNYVNVPSGRFSRFMNFTGMSAGITGNILLSAANNFLLGKHSNFQDLITSKKNIDRFVRHLSKMRGASMKVGQLLSLEAGDLLSNDALKILSQLRDQGYAMPTSQLREVLKKNWGSNFMQLFKEFDPHPIAAASIGQVHKCILKNNEIVAIKVQYPGVKNSIDSDIKNLGFLIKSTGILPPKIDLYSLLEIAKSQLYEEANYELEAKNLLKFSSLVKDKNFEIPFLYKNLCTKNILTMEYKPGIPIDKIVNLSKRKKNQIFYKLMELLFNEIFDFGYIQTDPNYSNFLYDHKKNKIILLDFGASQKISPEVRNKFKNLLIDTWNNDHRKIKKSLFDLGILHDTFPKKIEAIFLDFFYEVTYPIREKKFYNFDRTDIIKKIKYNFQEFIKFQNKLQIPSSDILFIQRKIGGLFFLGKLLKVEIDLNEILKKYI